MQRAAGALTVQVNQELLPRNEYLAAENWILRAKLGVGFLVQFESLL
jgi:hypothetical protein